MAKITLKGNEINTVGELPKVCDSAKDFTLVKSDLSRASLADFKGSKVIMNISPSIDTSTCATSVVKFNKAATSLNNTKVLYISKDLPFAQARFCGAEGIDDVVTLCDLSGNFGKDYGLEIADGPMAGLHSRVLIVLDEGGKVVYTQQVPEIVNEPNYEEALAAVK